MHTETSVTIAAPIARVFKIAADLALWPEILPHYRWIRFLEQSPQKMIVKMAARRKWIPIQWTSEYRIDAKKMEMHFKHLKAFTKGMLVVWTFTPVAEGVLVSIKHDLKSQIPLLGTFITETIIGKFFIDFIANQTLTQMKKHLENN